MTPLKNGDDWSLCTSPSRSFPSAAVLQRLYLCLRIFVFIIYIINTHPDG